MSSVALINPKFEHNVGGALRACSVWGVENLLWTNERVDHPDDWPNGVRLPREERMKLYKDVAIDCHPPTSIIDYGVAWYQVPVCVELTDNAEDLIDFVHPPEAMYVFGPEDGNVPKGIRTSCHRFVRIPSASCLNLSAAVNVVLYDRIAKLRRAKQTLGMSPDAP